MQWRWRLAMLQYSQWQTAVANWSCDEELPCCNGCTMASCNSKIANILSFSFASQIFVATLNISKNWRFFKIAKQRICFFQNFVASSNSKYLVFQVAMKTSIANMLHFFLEQEKHDEISSFGFMTVSCRVDITATARLVCIYDHICTPNVFAQMKTSF